MLAAGHRSSTWARHAQGVCSQREELPQPETVWAEQRNHVPAAH